MTAARNVAGQARQRLADECGLKEPAYVRRLDYLARWAAADPFGSVRRSAVYERCISFFDIKAFKAPATPLISARKDVEVFCFTSGEAFGFTYAVAGKAGYPTPLLEKTLGVPVTTRNWNTLVRLVERYA